MLPSCDATLSHRYHAQLTAIFGNAMTSASEDNLAFLKQLMTSQQGEVSRDEFSLWLLYLLGRIDSTDIKVARDVFDKFNASAGGSGSSVNIRDVAVATS